MPAAEFRPGIEMYFLEHVAITNGQKTAAGSSSPRQNGIPSDFQQASGAVHLQAIGLATTAGRVSVTSGRR